MDAMLVMQNANSLSSNTVTWQARQRDDCTRGNAGWILPILRLGAQLIAHEPDYIN